MFYTIERFDDLPVLRLSFADDAPFADIVVEVTDEIFAVLEQADQALYYIIDARNLQLSFNDILSSVQLSTKSPHANLNHRNIKQVIIISESKAIATVVRGLNTVSFGNINAIVFESPELALSYVRMNAA